MSSDLLLEKALAELRALREDVSYLRRFARPEQLVFSYREAAQLLGRSLKTVRRLVGDGKIFPVVVNRRKMISNAEIRRLLEPTPSTPRARRPRKTREPYSARDEAAEAREALKKR